MLSKPKRYLTYMVLATFPIMSLVDITPTLRMNLSLADVFVLLLGIVWIANIRSFRLKKHFPYAWYFMLYIFLLLISNLYNMHSPTVTDAGVTGMLSEIVKMVANAAFMFVAYNAVSEEGVELKGMFISWMVGLYLFMLYGLYAQGSQLAGVVPWTFNQALSSHSRFLGTLTDSNAAALYLSVSFFVVLFGKRYDGKSNGWLWWLNITNGLVMVCIVLTMSRGGLAGFLCGLVVWIAFNFKIYIRYLCVVPVALCLLLLVLVVDTRFLSNNILYTFTSRMQNATSENGMLKTRLNLSLTSVQMGLDHPVIGVGRGNFPLNSEPYLRNLGMNDNQWRYLYQNMVSHNTAAGVFAEMGFLGIGAVFSLFMILFIKTLKNEGMDRHIKIIILSLWVCIFVQSLAISLENARVVWIATGLLLCFVNRKVTFLREQVGASATIGVRTNICVTVSSLILCAVFYAYVGLRYTNGNIDISDSALMLLYRTESAGEHTLRYYVNTPKSDEDYLPMEVTVRKAGTDEVVDSVQYDATAKGYANLYFDANAFESFEINFNGRFESGINDVKMIDQSTGTRVLAGRYPLLPQALYDYCRQNGYLISNIANTKVEKTWLTQGVLNVDEWIDLGEKIRYKGVNIATASDGRTQFEFVFDCLEKLEQDYSLWMHLVVDDINTLSDAQRPPGYINCDHRMEIPTDTWQSGIEYRHVYALNLKKGNYSLGFGFWIPPSGDSGAMRLYAPSGNAGVNAGWFNVN